jgi:hypothetical protein
MHLSKQALRHIHFFLEENNDVFRVCESNTRDVRSIR